MPTTLPHRPDLAELLDAPETDPATLERNLRDIRLINRGLGWTAAVVGEVAATARAVRLRQFNLLDVATGSADIPLALEGWARRQGLDLIPFAADISRGVLRAARREVEAHAASRIALVRCDALRLPFADASVDIVTCSLALHHFASAAGERLLRELARVARHALIVTDLERSWAGYLGARLLTQVLRNRMTRHDAPVSVLRAYTAGELDDLARRAGLDGARVRRRFPFRLVLTWRRSAGGLV